MLLINCKVNLKPKRASYFILLTSVADNVNDDVDDNACGNSVVFTVKDVRFYVPVLTLSVKKTMKKYQNLLAENLMDHFIVVNRKQEVRIKEPQANIDIISNQTLLESMDCFFYCIYIKTMMEPI